jgi:hypothetical protein
MDMFKPLASVFDGRINREDREWLLVMPPKVARGIGLGLAAEGQGLTEQRLTDYTVRVGEENQPVVYCNGIRGKVVEPLLAFVNQRFAAFSVEQVKELGMDWLMRLGSSRC